MQAFQTVALVGRFRSSGIEQTLDRIEVFLRSRGLEVIRPISGTDHAGDVKPIASLPAHAIDLAIVVGGDGTMLGIARELAPSGVPVIGINHGRLGFMTDIPLDRWTEALAAILDGHYEAEERTLLDARVLRDPDSLVPFEARALNDVVVGRGLVGRMLELNVEVDGKFMYTQRADGLIIATPTGSTAYALSANGPILHPQLSGIVLVPVAPQALSNRPIVLPDTCTVTVRIGDETDARVNCDMQTFSDLHPGDRIVIQRSAHRTRFLHPTGYSYFATLRGKLAWQALPVLSARTP
ncbi:MAG: NAD kinase [Betaproteobacteria bacterium]|nr:NAD kinase [Betaproteobacteria bacterium]